MYEVNYIEIYLELIWQFYLGFVVSISVLVPLYVLFLKLYEKLLDSLDLPIPEPKKLSFPDVVIRSYHMFWILYKQYSLNKNLFGKILVFVLWLPMFLIFILLIPGSVIAYILYLLIKALRIIWNLGIKDDEVEY